MPAPFLSERTVAGLRMFNAGDFDGCHHLLQRVWVGDDGSGRLLLQAVIQLSAACIHIRHGHRHQALVMLARARPKLDRFRPGHGGVDVDALAAAAAEMERRLAAGEPLAVMAACCPQVRFASPVVPA